MSKSKKLSKEEAEKLEDYAADRLADILVKQIDHEKMKKDDKNLFQCPECKLHYQDKEWAEKCEAWCREHKSCNIEITAHAEESKKS